MTEITLETERLRLRPPRMEDAPVMQNLLQDQEIAENVAAIPHPYPEGMAEKQLKDAIAHLEEEKGYYFMITRTSDDALMGAIYSYHNPVHLNTILTYWLGEPYRGNGYISEALEALMRYGFEEDRFHRIWGCVFTGNPASARIMLKAGMKHEGTLREHWFNEGRFRDLEYYGMLRSEWEATHAKSDKG